MFQYSSILGHSSIWNLKYTFSLVIFHHFQHMIIHLIRMLIQISFSTGTHMHNITFLRVKWHLPRLRPIRKQFNIFLEFNTINLIINRAINNAVISKETNLRWNLVANIIYVKQKAKAIDPAAGSIAISHYSPGSRVNSCKPCRGYSPGRRVNSHFALFTW